MGEEIQVERIECHRDAYQIDIRYTETGKGARLFVRKDAMLAMLAVAEKEAIECQTYY